MVWFFFFEIGFARGFDAFMVFLSGVVVFFFLGFYFLGFPRLIFFWIVFCFFHSFYGHFQEVHGVFLGFIVIFPDVLLQVTGKCFLLLFFSCEGGNVSFVFLGFCIFFGFPRFIVLFYNFF